MTYDSQGTREHLRSPRINNDSERAYYLLKGKIVIVKLPDGTILSVTLYNFIVQSMTRTKRF
jgi:hypothetical protein